MSDGIPVDEAPTAKPLSGNGSDLEAAVMREQATEGIKCELPEGRSISMFPVDDGSFGFVFENNGVETRIRLSSEAVQAMHALWFELRARGLAA
jgi:hypothetical protein